MSALPPDSFPAAFRSPWIPPATFPAISSPSHKVTLAARWTAVHDAAAVVAALAGRAPDAATAVIPAALAEAGGQRLAMAGLGLEDLSAILEIGIRALLSVHARGASPQVAAEALWGEFCAARDAVLALCPPERGLPG